MTAAPTGHVPDPDGIKLTDLVRAELTKICTLPATWIALALALVADAVLGLLAATDAVRLAGSDGQASITHSGTVLLASVYAFAAVPVFAAGGEYRGGQMRVSLLAVPDRDRFFAAKLLAVLGVLVVAALPVVLPGGVAQHLLGDAGAGAAVDGLFTKAVAYSLLGLVAYGFAVLVRTVAAPLAVLVVLPVLVSPLLRGLSPEVTRLLPHEATLSFLGTPEGPDLALDRPVGLSVVLAWAVLTVGAAWTVTARRDG
ncbi:ABC transporter permease [Planomonospora sphaerica]|uniref:ABC transporter permease n=1 Tax=Planomonospora sphaerica TaxID=161355 RepID=A0A171DN33_9ACTN|nr:hypothetical protein [Planomonospora sphaerica]GAT70470.1 ABC transporter permease [Planomonospora sphaerica]